MRAVLGIDAAWTSNNPSGVALVQDGPTGWSLVLAASSYDSFIAASNPRHAEVPIASGMRMDCSLLLDACQRVLGRPVDLVAIDIPLSRSPIVGRRVSDDAVSKQYGGAKKCGTHSPSAARPGMISDDIREGFQRRGYPLCPSTVTIPGLIEVYPHPALLELARAPERLRYKYQKIAKYWPEYAKSARIEAVKSEWERIASLLDTQVHGVSKKMPNLAPEPRPRDFKAYEDALDAVVCAWVGICALEDRAQPYGDDTSGIWIPKATWSRLNTR